MTPSLCAASTHVLTETEYRLLGTEALYLLRKKAFSSGYRPVETRTYAENERTKQSASRAGYQLEAILRQRWVVKGRNQDSAVYSTIDKDWPAISAACEEWLSPANQTPFGQKTSLSE